MGTKQETISYNCQEMHVTAKCRSELGNENPYRIIISLRAGTERLPKPKKGTEVKKLDITVGKITSSGGTQELCM